MFVFLYFLRSSIFFTISCATHGFLTDFSNFKTICFNVSSNIPFTFFHTLSASGSSLSPSPSVSSLRNLISISFLTSLLLFLKFSKFCGCSSVLFVYRPLTCCDQNLCQHLGKF
uniref:Putative secreted protein n=1 Tax=Xenopsylla cheopis TaxID=163159 RepID=A0A6M2DZA2_XENCH